MGDFTEQDREMLRHKSDEPGFQVDDRKMLVATWGNTQTLLQWKEDHKLEHTTDNDAYMKVLDTYDKRLNGHSQRIDSIRDRLLVVMTGAALVAGLITLLDKLGIL